MTKRFEVSGTNEWADTWTFGTDDEERARDMLKQMQEDLGDVKLKENGQ